MDDIPLMTVPSPQLSLDEIKAEHEQLDSKAGRLVEDLITALGRIGVITPKMLPKEAQEILSRRKFLRDQYRLHMELQPPPATET